MKLHNLETWERREHFEFFTQFEEPFFGVCVDLDFTTAYQKSKESGSSFFLYYLHKAMIAVNKTESFRYRIDSQKNVVVYDKVGVSATINRENGTFGFSYMPYFEDFSTFEAQAKTEIERIRKSESIFPPHLQEEAIHFSSIPWIKFTSLSHARRFSSADSVPKISVGKMTESSGRKIMPVSVHVHHALMDGIHLGQFLESFQTELDH